MENKRKKNQVEGSGQCVGISTNEYHGLGGLSNQHFTLLQL